MSALVLWAPMNPAPPVTIPRIAGPPGSASERPCRSGHDRLQLQVVLQALAAELPADPAGLVSAEGGHEVHGVLVHTEGARAYPAGDVEATVGVRRPHRAGQPVIRIVGQA